MADLSTVDPQRVFSPSLTTDRPLPRAIDETVQQDDALLSGNGGGPEEQQEEDRRALLTQSCEPTQLGNYIPVPLSTLFVLGDMAYVPLPTITIAGYIIMSSHISVTILTQCFSFTCFSVKQQIHSVDC